MGPYKFMVVRTWGVHKNYRDTGKESGNGYLGIGYMVKRGYVHREYIGISGTMEEKVETSI